MTTADFEPRSQAAAAPERPARRAAGGGPRAFAGALLIAVAAGAGTLGSYAWRYRVTPATHRTVPFILSDSVWKAVRSVARPIGAACPPRVPVAVLYISRSCTHCAAELDRWAAHVRRGAPELWCVAIAVVAPFANASPESDWLPAELAPQLVWDRASAIGRALDARMVPVAAFVTRDGVVSARFVGESSDAATLERFRALRGITANTPGEH